MDFIFGTLATDELKLVHHRTLRRGVQHQHQMSPGDPLPGEPVTLTTRVGGELAHSHVTIYYTTDGSIPSGQYGTAANGFAVACQQMAYEWDTLAWAYLAIWQGTIPAQPEGTVVRYRISAWDADAEGGAGGGTEVFADYPELKATTERAAAAFFKGEPVPKDPPPSHARIDTFTYYVDTYTPPQWAQDAVIYQVLVDRFYPGDGKSWLQTDNLAGFFGGTLWGVCDKLDYIAELGVNCIWLCPTFPSPTAHGYDITDYEHIEPRMGGDDALRALVTTAHARGIRVLLDLVCNHISSQHPYFVEALNNPQSVYREWFIFDETDPNGYKTFFGVPTMPFIDLNNPAARAWMLDIARYWLREFDIDGYRLDHANGPGADFWADFRAACREVKPDSLCFGEVVESPDILRAYMGRLDGLLDFHLEDALRRTFAFSVMTESDLERFIARHYAYFESPQGFVMPTFLDNHDMDRFLYVAKGDKDALRRAAAFQMRLPQPPIIYYGTEVGLSQSGSSRDHWGLEISRVAMPWGDAQDKELLAFYKEIIAARKQGNMRP